MPSEVTLAGKHFKERLNKALLILLSSNLDSDDEEDLWETDFYMLIDEMKEDRASSLSTAYSFLEDEDLNKRYLAITLLGQLCNPINTKQEEADALDISSRISTRVYKEKSVACLSAMADTLGFTGVPQAEASLLLLSFNRDKYVRLSATIAMGGLKSESISIEIISRLIELSKDSEPAIRSWATMWLAGLEEYSDEVISALKKRLSDIEADTDSEAIYGFAYHSIPGGLPYLKDILQRESIIDKNIESAGLYGDPSLYPLVQNWVGFAGEKLVEWALRRCSSKESEKLSVDDEWFNDESYTNLIEGRRVPTYFRSESLIGKDKS